MGPSTETFGILAVKSFQSEDWPFNRTLYVYFISNAFNKFVKMPQTSNEGPRTTNE